MKVFELTSEGKLTKQLAHEIGDELSISERIRSKTYGLGHLMYKSGNSVLDEFYERHNNTIKTHFDWTKKGAVIRVRTLNKLYAIGLEEWGFKNITITKHQDYIYAFPFMPFWILLRLGVRMEIAKWFRLRGDKIDRGRCELTIEHNDNVMNFELAGDLWINLVNTFARDKVKTKLTVDDRRTWVTDNGFKVNDGNADSRRYQKFIKH
jgi:hypothetical protein